MEKDEHPSARACVDWEVNRDVREKTGTLSFAQHSVDVSSDTPTLELRPRCVVLPEVEAIYNRYHIHAVPAPPIHPVPNKFRPQIVKRKLAAMLIKESWRMFTRRFEKSDGYSFRTKWKALFDRPCKYGVLSGRLGGFKPILDKCTGCFGCVIGHPDVVKDVVVNESYLDLAKMELTAEAVENILYEAATGKQRVSGGGYRGPFSGFGWDSIWLDMSEIVRPTRDGKEGREYISTTAEIGRRPFRLNGGVLNVLSIQLPIVFGVQNAESIDEAFLMALVGAARNCGTLAFVQIDQMETLDEVYHPFLALSLTAREADAVVAGDHNLRTKIIEVESDDSEVIRALKETLPSSILIARLDATSNLEETAIGALRCGADGLHIVADRRGMETSDPGRKPRHMRDIVRSIHNSLIKEGMRSEVTLIGSGGIDLAEHVVKSIGCGLDVVAIDAAVHVALQSEVEREGQGWRAKPRLTDHKWGAQRLTNLMAAWHEQIIEALSAMGKRDVRRLTGDEGRLILYEEMREVAFGDIEKAGDCAHVRK